MKRIVLACCVALSACGGGNTDPATVQPPPVSQTSGAIVFIGDSITAAWPLPSDITNVGVPGNKSADMLARFDAVLAARPAVVAILAGTNDVRYKPDADTRDVARMAELVAASGACVIVGTIPPINDWLEDTQFTIAEGDARVGQWNTELRYLAQSYGYRLADYHAALITADGKFDASLFQDTVHPNAAGYARMATIIEPMLNCGHR